MTTQKTKISVALCVIASSIFFGAVRSEAEECGPIDPGWGNAQSTGTWSLKVGAFCENTWRFNADTIATKPMEVIGLPSSCRSKANKAGVALTCSKPGEYRFSVKLHAVNRNKPFTRTWDIKMKVYN
ncbi:hypothetical protein [uncultured Sulfuricurvum sp.]|uniref:hypothetical protein n=1 Tax=uncultured Sulfuricurvum sp. TaxID=430693 RepID=UPI0026242AF5|nr:hypothetical protein [uncultured Sulfuricurvum sp.]